MKTLLALAIGYAVGAKTAGKDLDRLGQSLKALYGTEEFADVVAAARSQVSATLREFAAIVDSEQSPPIRESDLVSRVRNLVTHD